MPEYENAEARNRDRRKADNERNNEGTHGRIYDSDKYISEGRRVPSGTVPLNILTFQYPFYCVYICTNYFFSPCIF